MKRYLKYDSAKESKARNKAIRDKMIEKAKAKQLSDELADKTCAFFGCGKKLTHLENLFSNYCFKHQRNDSQAQKVDLLR